MANIVTVFGISGIVWIPFVLLFWILFYEQFNSRRYPQYLIILFLALDNTLRCIWFFGYDVHHASIFFLVMNRVAILLQFTALSLLILMWSRVLRVSTRLVSESIENESDSDKYNRASLAATSRNSHAISLVPTNTSDPKTNGDSKMDAESLFVLWLTVTLNVLVWLFVCLTIILAKYFQWSLYDVNILFLSIVCVCEAIWIFGVGLRTGLRISHELAPTFLSWRLTPSSEKTKSMKLRACCSGLYFFLFQYRDHTRLRAQGDAIRKLVIASSTIAIFFLLRSLAFAFRLYIKPNANSAVIDGENTYGYPYFFYQIPEFIPNLAIAIAISPANSILRKLTRCVRWACSTMCGLSDCIWPNNRNVRNSESMLRASKSRSNTSGTEDTRLFGNPRLEREFSDEDYFVDNNSTSDGTPRPVTSPKISSDSSAVSKVAIRIPSGGSRHQSSSSNKSGGGASSGGGGSNADGKGGKVYQFSPPNISVASAVVAAKDPFDDSFSSRSRNDSDAGSSFGVHISSSLPSESSEMFSHASSYEQTGDNPMHWFHQPQQQQRVVSNGRKSSSSSHKEDADGSVTGQVSFELAGSFANSMFRDSIIPR